jgi:hypothetical protein
MVVAPHQPLDFVQLFELPEEGVFVGILLGESDGEDVYIFCEVLVDSG